MDEDFKGISCRQRGTVSDSKSMETSSLSKCDLIWTGKCMSLSLTLRTIWESC